MRRPRKHPRAGDLAKLARLAMAIEGQQIDHPEFSQDTLEAIVTAELRKLECEQARMEMRRA